MKPYVSNLSMPSGLSNTLSKPNKSVLLIQLTKQMDSRYFLDFETQWDAIESFVQLYEKLLKMRNETTSDIKYTIKDVLDFIDNTVEVVLLIFDSENEIYRPFGKDIFKSLFLHLYLEEK